MFPIEREMEIVAIWTMKSLIDIGMSSFGCFSTMADFKSFTDDFFKSLNILNCPIDKYNHSNSNKALYL